MGVARAVVAFVVSEGDARGQLKHRGVRTLEQSVPYFSVRLDHQALFRRERIGLE
jgi:hypothetical protein